MSLPTWKPAGECGLPIQYGAGRRVGLPTQLDRQIQMINTYRALSHEARAL